MAVDETTSGEQPEDETCADMTRAQRVRERLGSMSRRDKIKAGAVLAGGVAATLAVMRWGGSLVRRVRH